MKIHTLLLCLLVALPAHAQEFSGYVSDMPSLISLSPGNATWWQNQVHSRFNLGWQPSKHWRADAGIRSRLLAGSRAMVAAGSAEADNGWIDLSWNWARGSRLSGNTVLDRLNVTFEKGKWKLQLGRQRINWGQTFVWNPNDLFNTYSFFDFDYPERPGSDALRATYFRSETASLEAAASVSRDGRVTAAAQYRWNRHNVDYQLIVGEQAETDLVVGGAWTGDFNGLNFRGEFSCYHPLVRTAETGSVVALSVGLDYIFSNSLMLQAEALYNNAGGAVAGDGLTGLYSAPLSSKRLSVCDWSLFAQAAYPVTSRLNVSLSGIYFADIKSFYAGLTADCSLAENLDLSVIGQFFSSPSASPSAADGLRTGLSFVRLKYSF
jgi:hypothetical protein